MGNQPFRRVDRTGDKNSRDGLLVTGAFPVTILLLKKRH